MEQGSISVMSPLGQAILGSEVGDEVVVKTPGGVREFEVLKDSALGISI